MESTRTRIELEQMAQARKTHPDFTTTGIDVLVLKKIDDIVTKEVKTYNEKNKTIIKSKLEIEKLKGKEDDESLNKVKELESIIDTNKSEIEKVKEDVKVGKKTEDIIKSLRELQVANPDNAIRDNLQLVGYTGKELNKTTKDTAVNYIQSLIDVKFRNNDIRNNYSKYNKNIFDIKKSAEQAAAELAKNTLNP